MLSTRPGSTPIRSPSILAFRRDIAFFLSRDFISTRTNRRARSAPISIRCPICEIRFSASISGQSRRPGQDRAHRRFRRGVSNTAVRQLQVRRVCPSALFREAGLMMSSTFDFPRWLSKKCKNTLARVWWPWRHAWRTECDRSITLAGASLEFAHSCSISRIANSKWTSSLRAMNIPPICSTLFLQAGLVPFRSHAMPSIKSRRR